MFGSNPWMSSVQYASMAMKKAYEQGLIGVRDFRLVEQASANSAVGQLQRAQADTDLLAARKRRRGRSALRRDINFQTGVGAGIAIPR